MLTFTTPINVENIQKCKLKRPLVDGDTSTLFVNCEVLGTGNIVYKGRNGADGLYLLIVKNGLSIGLRQTVSPTGYDDKVETFAINTPTGFTTAVSDYHNGGATETLRLKALETSLKTVGILNFIGTVA